MNKLVIIAVVTFCIHLSSTQDDEEWSGRWFPERSGITIRHPSEHTGIPMGVVADCDDGKTNLDVDYDGGKKEYTCFDNKKLFLPQKDIHPLLQQDHVPRFYSAPHYCMNVTIKYKHEIPTFGGHRPVWPQYGEYNYLPPQRWLHSLEHGSVAMLYHPCANNEEVKLLKDVVRNCIFRHVITANYQLTPERPLALVTWGNKLLMSKFDMTIAIKFIKAHANRAPEKTTANGNYTLGLLVPSKKVSNDKDNQLCTMFTNANHM